MGNMSYCRFENTSRDLLDCLDAIQSGEIDDLNDYEQSGLRGILEYAKEIVDMEEEIIDSLENQE